MFLLASRLAFRRKFLWGVGTDGEFPRKIGIKPDGATILEPLWRILGFNLRITPVTRKYD